MFDNTVYCGMQVWPRYDPIQPTHILFMSNAPRTWGFFAAIFPSRDGV